MRWFYTSTTGWALTLCLLGLVVPLFLPWCVTSPHIVLIANVRDRRPPMLYGYDFLLAPEPLGWLLVLTLFATICLMVATQPLSPVPLWRSGLLAIMGSVVIGLTTLAIYRLRVEGLAVSLRVGPFFLASVGGGLVLIASAEVRQHVLHAAERAKRKALHRLAQDDAAAPPSQGVQGVQGVQGDGTEITTWPERKG